MRPIGRSIRKQRPPLAFVAGALAWLGAMAVIGALASVAQRHIVELPPWLAVALMALMLKPSFAWRMLDREVGSVETALGAGLETARNQLARICSRDVK